MNIKGISACPGVVSGPAFIFQQPDLTINTNKIQDSMVEAEIQRFLEARTKSEEQLDRIRTITLENVGVKEASIFEGHKEILIDQGLADEVTELIRETLCTADYAVHNRSQEYISTFEDMDDPYFKARAADMKDIFKRLIANILGVEIPLISDIQTPSIIVAFDLTPSDTAQMDKDKVLGFVTAEGGPTSHVAIMSRTMMIPAIVGATGILDHIGKGDHTILDAVNGHIIARPNPDEIKIYKQKGKQFAEEQNILAELKDLPAETKDGTSIELVANVGTDIDAPPAIAQGAEGVGLYRSEFLYMDRINWPTEEEQYIAYSNVVRAFDNKLIVIRTLDIGGDKELPYLKFPHELNPFLGWRALRICLDRRDIFKTQLRAILRASSLGPVGIMYPMVISLDEVQQANSILEECKQELREEGTAFDENIQQGVMIETPAAAMIASELADIVNFFSYGTNDLTQYTLAVDRGNPNIVALYDSYSPSVLRLMAHATKAAKEKGAWVGVCGELGGDPIATLFFLGIGVKELSMSAINIPKVKRIVRQANQKDAEAIANKALTMGSGKEIKEYLTKEMQKLIS